MAAKSYDLLVIGAGSGGMAFARRAAEFGVKAAVFESGRLGGTCVNVGCVPKKVMFNAASVYEACHDAPGYGVDVTVNGFDYAKIKAARDKYVERLNGIYERNLGKSGIDIIRGKAEFENPTTLKCGEDTYTAKHICVATGGYPTMPNIPGIELAMNSDGFFEMEEIPKKVAVVGSGYIAVELAGIMNILGADVSLIIRHHGVLRNFDQDLSAQLLDELESSGINVIKNSTVSMLEKTDDGIDCHLVATNESLPCAERHLKGVDKVLMAIGRMPNANIGLDKAGVKQDGKGYIVVDEFQNTSQENIYALGDVCGKVELTPVAIAAGRKLAHRLFEPRPQYKQDFDTVPSAVFSHPPCGVCGLTQAEAEKEYGAENIKIYKSTFTNMYFSPIERKQKTMMKIICKLPEEKVVGLHMIGIAVDEILQGFGVAMRMGATKADFDNCVAIHPTAAEELVTMR